MYNPVALPPPANQIAAAFAEALGRMDGEMIVGIYLTGSIAMNDFHPNKSDIDFIVLCKELPGKETAKKLKNIHRNIARQHRGAQLSGMYLAYESISVRHPEDSTALIWHEGTTKYGPFEMAPVSLWELKTTAITISGTATSQLPIPIDQQELKRFLHKNINTYWIKWRRGYSTFSKQRLLLLLFPRLTEWVLLGIARQLCTLQTGRIISKTEAGHYALEHIPSRFHPIIRQALAVRQDQQSYPVAGSYAIRPSFKRAARTVDCAKHMIGMFNSVYASGNIHSAFDKL